VPTAEGLRGKVVLVDVCTDTCINCSAYSWYDNEVGYTDPLVEHVREAAKHAGVAV
jgi:hypothetical protein